METPILIAQFFNSFKTEKCNYFMHTEYILSNDDVFSKGNQNIFSTK